MLTNMIKSKMFQIDRLNSLYITKTYFLLYLIRIYERKERQLQKIQTITTLLLSTSLKIIRNRRILYSHLFGILKLLLHEFSGNMKTYSRKKNHIYRGQRGKYYFSYGNKSSYFLHHNAIKV